MMRSLLSVVAAALLAAPVLAQEKGATLDPAKAGIAVYPGARPDAATTTFVREQLKMTGAAYRTGDEVAKVADFYAKQPGFNRMPGADKEQVGFSAGCKPEYNPYLKKDMQKCGYHVTVQNPFMDMRTGQLVKETLVTVVKQ